MKKLFNILLFSGLSLALFNGCKNPADDVNIQVSTDIFKSPTVLVFKNINPAGTEPTNVSVEFIGAQAGLVRTVTGGTNFKVSNGYIPVVLDRSANPSTNSPVKFTVLVSAPGFASTYQDVYITDPKATNQYVVTLQEFAKPLPGTTASVTNHAITAGKVASTIQLSSPLGASVNERVYITIPAGTSLLDKNKAVINSSQLEARVLYSTTVNGVAPQITGGSVSTNVLNAAGTKLAYGKMGSPDASATIKLTAGSTEVKFFSNPITIEYEINTSLVNPVTKVPYAEGDKLEMHSVDFATGAWKEEGTMTIEKASSGKLVAKKQVDHLTEFIYWIQPLSYINFNYNISPFIFTQISLPNHFIGPFIGTVDDGANGKLNVEIKRDKADYDEMFYYTGDEGLQESVILMKGELSKKIQVKYNYLLNFSVEVSTSSFRYKNQLITVKPPKVANSSVIFSFESQTAAPITATGMLYYQCSGKRINSPLNADVKMVDVKTNQSSIVSIRNGVFNATLIEGNDYKIIAEIDGTSFSHTFTASKTGIKLPNQAGFALELLTIPAGPDGEVSLYLKGTVTGSCN